MTLKPLAAAAVACTLSFATPSIAADPPRSIVSLYLAAPGQQVALLKWFAAQDKAAAAVGIAPSQVYAHMQGDSWDYLIISPMTTDAQDSAMDAELAKMGMTTGPRASIQFRTMIASHTDTLSVGPTTAGAILAGLGDK